MFGRAFEKSSLGCSLGTPPQRPYPIVQADTNNLEIPAPHFLTFLKNSSI
jgi:hypothetical protein